MSAMAFQITCVSIDYSTVCSGTDQWKHESSLRVIGFCQGNSPVTGKFSTQRPVTRKMFPFHDVIMPFLVSRGCREFSLLHGSSDLNFPTHIVTNKNLPTKWSRPSTWLPCIFGKMQLPVLIHMWVYISVVTKCETTHKKRCQNQMSLGIDHCPVYTSRRESDATGCRGSWSSVVHQKGANIYQYLILGDWSSLTWAVKQRKKYWIVRVKRPIHYNDVIMSFMASQITNLTSVYSTVYLWRRSKKSSNSASLAFVQGIHR